MNKPLISIIKQSNFTASELPRVATRKPFSGKNEPRRGAGAMRSHLPIELWARGGDEFPHPYCGVDPSW